MSKFNVLFYLLSAIGSIIFISCKSDNVSEPVTKPDTAIVNYPVLLYPANNTTQNGSNIQFNWENYSGANAYKIQISSDANFVIGLFADTTLSPSEYTLTNNRLNLVSNYYWRVKAYTNTDSSNWTPVWRFNIILLPPEPPVLLYPENFSINIPFLPVFRWNNVLTAEEYRIQVSSNNNFNNTLIDSGRITSLQFQTPLFFINTNTQYFWRVRASNSQGLSTGQWSSIWNFTTVSGPHPNSISGRVTFTDNHFPPGGIYLVEVSNNWPPFSIQNLCDTLIIQQSGGSIFADYSVLRLINSPYYLRTTFRNANDQSKILGIYGCDTNRIIYSNCPSNPPFVTIQNNNGLENINILSWSDTSKIVYP